MERDAQLIGPLETYQPGTLESIRRGRGIGGVANLEKALWALEYVNQLSRAGLDYVLKGGTAVQLVSEPSWPRFSIDVDICTTVGPEELERVLSSIDVRFDEGFEFHRRRSANLDEESFRGYKVTTPGIGGPSRRILLDAYLSMPDLPHQATPVRSFFYASEGKVMTPTAGALAGDKLTILAPSSVGRKLVDSRRGVEYAKHMFDIQRLIRSDPDPSDVRSSFETIIDEQSSVRGVGHTVEEVVQDVLRVCQVVATLNLSPGWRGENVPDLPIPLDRMRYIFRRGVRDFRPFLASDTAFGADELVCAAGEVALLVVSCHGERDLTDVIDVIAGGTILERTPGQSRRIIDDAPPEHRWCIDHRAGLYSRDALAIWSEVIRTQAGG